MLNLYLHFPALVLDGLYASLSPFARPVFHPAPQRRVGPGHC